MRNRRRHLVGTSAALLLALAAVPAAHASSMPTGRKGSYIDRNRPVAPSTLASEAQKPFIMPQSRPTEDRPRPTDNPDPNRNAYSVPEAKNSPACARHFCVHWVDQGLDAPEPIDKNGNGVPDFVERVLRVAEHVHTIENGKLGWREPRSDGRIGGLNGKTDV
ncbi:MAG TPA: hypothetical protein VNN15_08560, partial [Solirubrobacterales bacterium]|nr:hypothetical protein [Solirubrobacterales bacterium]